VRAGSSRVVRSTDREVAAVGAKFEAARHWISAESGG
jgi:hypothetical protein